jgi:hypothetical protein
MKTSDRPLAVVMETVSHRVHSSTVSGSFALAPQRWSACLQPGENGANVRFDPGVLRFLDQGFGTAPMVGGVAVGLCHGSWSWPSEPTKRSVKSKSYNLSEGLGP